MGRNEPEESVVSTVVVVEQRSSPVLLGFVWHRQETEPEEDLDFPNWWSRWFPLVGEHRLCLYPSLLEEGLEEK